MMNGTRKHDPLDSIMTDLKRLGYNSTLLHSNPKVHQFREGWDKVIDFHKIHAFVHPSSHEGGNRTIIEAAACDLPIITTDTGTASTIVTEKYIIMLEGDTVADITELLRELEADPGLALRIGMGNRERAKVYDWKPITETWVKILESVL